MAWAPASTSSASSSRSSRRRPRPRSGRSLYIDDEQVGSLEDVKIQNGKFALAGEGLNIGRDGGSPVTWDCPGERPWPFAGGTIKRVVVDVSGRPYIDLEKEAMAVLSRE
jgi:hypothetical protein